MTTLEISVVSAEGLTKQSSYFNRVRPFITITKLPAQMVYQYEGGEHVFRVPLDPTFFTDTQYSGLHLQLYNKPRFAGPTQLGWCLITPSDVALPHLPSSHSVRYLSYRLRAKDGSRTHFIVNLAIRLYTPYLNTCHPVTGLPVTALRKQP